MSTVRVLVGTRKGAFILTSDGKREKWDVSGPHFAGWEMYHLKGSPADPNRIYASQTLRADSDDLQEFAYAQIERLFIHGSVSGD